MPYPNFNAGQRLTAALANAGKPEYVQTNGPQSNATMVMADALGLGFWTLANSLYRIELRVAYDAPTATDARFQWWPGNGAAVMARNLQGLAVGAATNIGADAAQLRVGAFAPHVVGGTGGAVNAFSLYSEDIILRTGGADGWAAFQYSANAAGTVTVQDGSFLIHTKLA